MKKIVFFLLLLAVPFVRTAAQNDDSDRDGKSRRTARREVVVLGSEIVRDTTGSKSSRHLKTYEIIPKGEWAVGTSIAYANLSSDNSEFMLLLDGMNASASIFRATPYVSWAYHRNQTIGVKFQYTSANGALDSGTLDLLNEGLSFDVSNLGAKAHTFSAGVCHRSFVGLDKRGIVGLVFDFTLGYGRSRTQFFLGDTAEDKYTINNKVKLAFSPGVIFFPMNFISVHLGLSVADVTYNMVDVYDGGHKAGERDFWRAQARLNLLDLNFGLSVHL